jgi:hypothetical protein
MHYKIDIGLINFFFLVIYKLKIYLRSYLGPKNESQFIMYINYEGLSQHKISQIWDMHLWNQNISYLISE